ncbi:hypothetical protein [Lactiplantibacillus daowaiensis]|uniref:Uncharacterized protein n=1 Tax=Lactiplantibacillus daowaiensis TaxID=2559918 RepID=A0ABW1RYT2_9LACO|nr:hypothetical protein [Lactiplantibacillus daowaiensis]
MSIKVKHESDVNLTINILRPDTSLGTPLIEIFTKGDKPTGVYGDTDTLAEDYDETTEVYKKAAAMWELDSYTAPIEVVSVPTASRHTPVVSVDKDGVVTATDTIELGIVTGAKNHLYDGALYVLLDDSFTSDEVIALSDFLYDQQRLMLIVKVASIDELKPLAAHVSAYQAATNVLSNTAAMVVPQVGNYSLDQAAAYAASNVPTDWQHIGGATLTEFDPNSGLTIDDSADIQALRGMTVVNKSGDNMLLNGMALGNNYIDQFVHTMLVGDAIETAIQKYLNHHNFPNYDDNTINELKETILSVTDGYLTQGVLEAQSDGTSAIISVPKRANVSNADVANRKLKNITINTTTADDVDTVDGKLNVTL